MNLSAWAGRAGVSKYAVCPWYHAGTLPVPARRAGRLILVEPAVQPHGQAVVCAGVSSADQGADLDRRVAGLTSWVTANRLAVGEVVTEIGSGMNGRRRKLGCLLADPGVAMIAVERRDCRDCRARFGVEHIQAALAAQGWQIMILDPGELDDDLVRDLTEVLASLCACRFGRRGARNRAVRALDCARAPAPLAAGEAGARQLAGELTAEQVRARIGREQDAARNAAVYRAAELLRRACGGADG